MVRRTLFALAGVTFSAIAVPAGFALAGESGPAEPSLPTLPGVAEQVDGLYDDQGCLRTGEATVDCSVRAEQVDRALADGGPGDVRHLEGFTGSQYLAHPTGTGPVVLEDSVASGDGAITGLVRNEGPTTVAEIEVTARVGGRELVAISPVHDVRPGEPVPFTIETGAPAAQVEWSAAAIGTGDEAHRALAWTPYWEQPGGRRAPIATYLYRERGPGPHPHVLFGSVGSAPAEVVVAWTAAGRVVATAMATTEPGGDVLVATDAAIPPTAETMVWAQA